jgi:hypothetical protein
VGRERRRESEFCAVMIFLLPSAAVAALNLPTSEATGIRGWRPGMCRIFLRIRKVTIIPEKTGNQVDFIPGKGLGDLYFLGIMLPIGDVPIRTGVLAPARLRTPKRPFSPIISMEHVIASQISLLSNHYFYYSYVCAFVLLIS